MEQPFAPSLFVEIRKRMGQGVFEVFHGAIIAAFESTKLKKSMSALNPCQSDPVAQPQKPDDEDDPPPNSGSITEECANEKKDKLILDATVAPQAIRYPTDLSLLNEAREFSEQIIDRLYPETPLKRKPRTYREHPAYPTIS